MTIAGAAAITVGARDLVPLLVLAAAFEAVFALHVNVERSGRYAPVFHEDANGWEQVVMIDGDRFPVRAPTRCSRASSSSPRPSISFPPRSAASRGKSR